MRATETPEAVVAENYRGAFRSLFEQSGMCMAIVFGTLKVRGFGCMATWWLWLFVIWPPIVHSVQRGGAKTNPNALDKLRLR